MALTTYTFNQIVSGITTATQAACVVLLDFKVGSILRALAQAVAGQLLWLQAIVLQVLTLTRASTSVGADLDSWCADFGFARLPARAATGQVTFSRFTATQQAVVPVGTTVQTTDGSQSFTVTTDTSNSAYDAGQGGYVIPANTASVNVPVQATSGGSGGNVQAGAITVITSSITGVDTVTNATGFLNGVDAEPDAALRARFVLYLASLSKATKAAIGSAILGVQQGLNYTITENEAYNGTADMGYFYVVVDDGSGQATSDLLAAVGIAIDAVRPFTSSFGVFAPVAVAANVGMAITSASGFNHATVVGNVGVALTAFLNTLTLGVSVPFTQIASVAYGVPGVQNVTGVTLNSGTADLAANQKQRIVAGTMTISQMATGDQSDFISRIKAVLPGGWFRDETPILDGVLGGIGWALAAAYSLAAYARLQARILTATDGFLDLMAFDYFGGGLPRRTRENDAAYRARILAALFPEKGTRRGLIRTLEILTGRTPWVFEPRRPADTGGYGVGGVGYGVAGGYGSIEMPFQAFVIAYRPIGQGIPNIAGYGVPQGAYSTPSQAMYADPSLIQGAVTDADIYAAIDAVKPAATIVWTQIQS